MQLSDVVEGGAFNDKTVATKQMIVVLHSSHDGRDVLVAIFPINEKTLIAEVFLTLRDKIYSKGGRWSGLQSNRPTSTLSATRRLDRSSSAGSGVVFESSFKKSRRGGARSWLCSAAASSSSSTAS